MIEHKVAQGSQEWLELRAGIPTASCFHRIITPATLKPSKQAGDYLNALLAEWIMGAPIEGPETEWMERGTNLEPEAARAYACERDVDPVTCGFFTTDDGMVGASPDRLVGDGLLELKCPSPQVHAGYLLNMSVDEKYMAQLQGQLWICERPFVDIQSYHPGMPPVIIRVNYNEQYIGLLSTAVRTFVAVLMDARKTIEGRYADWRPARKKVDTVRPDDPLGVSPEDCTHVWPELEPDLAKTVRENDAALGGYRHKILPCGHPATDKEVCGIPWCEAQPGAEVRK